MTHISTREKIIMEVEAFLRKTGMTKSRFGIDSVGNDKILEHMKAGKNPRCDTIDDMRLFMRLYLEAKKKEKREARLQRFIAA